MIPLVLLALGAFSLDEIDLGDTIVDARVVDLDGDGREDVVAVGERYLYLLRGGRGPAVKRDAAPLTVVGRGLCGVVRDGRYHRVQDPFGAWRESVAGAPSLLAALGRNKPGLLLAPGDVDGDGHDDVALPGREGFSTDAGLLPVVPGAELTIRRNETFAVEYRIPVPVVGRWSGGPAREFVFFHDDRIESFDGTESTGVVPLRLPTRGRTAESIRRNHVFLRDIDGDGRLDLLVVVAKGSTGGLFGTFEATARYWRGGRIYHAEKQGFFRPASFLKVAGVLLRPSLVDLDGDGDLDLVLATVGTTPSATGSVDGTYHLFRFEKRGYRRNPAWTLEGKVPLSAFTSEPQPPVRFLPDLDRNGRPEALAVGKSVRLLEADREGRFRVLATAHVSAPRLPVAGRTLAVVPYGSGLLRVGARR